MRAYLISWVWVDSDLSTYIAIAEMEDEQAQLVRDRLIAIEQGGDIISSAVEAIDEFLPVSFEMLRDELDTLFAGEVADA